MYKSLCVASLACVLSSMALAAPAGVYAGDSSDGKTMQFALDDSRVLRWETSPVVGWYPEASQWLTAAGAAQAVKLDTQTCMLYTHGKTARALICGRQAGAPLSEVVYIRDYPASMAVSGAQVLKCIQACSGQLPAQLRLATQAKKS